jgi:transcription elongation GreA/GreB family factor
LHLNSKGKEESAKKIVNTIKDIFNEKEVDTITMKLKEEHVMDREKNHIPLVNINQTYEKKKMNHERTRDLTIVKTGGGDVDSERVNMRHA